MVAGEPEGEEPQGEGETGRKGLEPHGFLQENLHEGSGFCFILKVVALCSHLPNLWVLTVPRLLYPASNQLSLRANRQWSGGRQSYIAKRRWDLVRNRLNDESVVLFLFWPWVSYLTSLSLYSQVYRRIYNLFHRVMLRIKRGKGWEVLLKAHSMNKIVSCYYFPHVKNFQAICASLSKEHLLWIDILPGRKEIARKWSVLPSVMFFQWSQIAIKILEKMKCASIPSGPYFIIVLHPPP